MRLAGKPAAQWREVAGRARQNYRYLAEDAKARGAPDADVANHQKNSELVLNLEQSSLDELYAKARPKDSPTGKANGLGPPGLDARAATMAKTSQRCGNERRNRQWLVSRT